MIHRFYVRGQGHSPLSNFSEHPITIDGVEYATVEHWYQCEKTLDPEQREAVRLAPTAKESKRLGRRVTLREDWAAVQIPVMRTGLEAKFTRESEAGLYLLGTGDQGLIEGNDWGDKFWGMCFEDGRYVGQNWLGILLMARRAQLRAT
jgi:ribA/ribD-fused uncharacterized protein